VKEKNPNRIIEHAVKGMLPKTKLGKAVFRNMYVYEGAEHNQEAQQPKLINLSDF
jgi:large subunit ribosomal protein L13